MSDALTSFLRGFYISAIQGRTWREIAAKPYFARAGVPAGSIATGRVPRKYWRALGIKAEPTRSPRIAVSKVDPERAARSLLNNIEPDCAARGVMRTNVRLNRVSPHTYERISFISR